MAKEGQTGWGEIEAMIRSKDPELQLTGATAANTNCNARKPSGQAILDDGRWGRARDWWFGGPWSACKGPGTRPARRRWLTAVSC